MNATAHRVGAQPERGETLVELLVTVAILGIGVVSIVFAMGSAITASDAHRKQSTVETVLRNYAEALEDPSVAYVPCAPASAYASPPGFTAPANFAVEVVQVRYWNGEQDAQFLATCPDPDRGAQLLTIRARSDDERGRKTLNVVKRAS